jgi:hypothetical protein
MTQVGFSLAIQGWGNSQSLLIKNKSHMTLLIDAEKAFDKIQQHFISATLNKLG